jgi:hypothetical protein
MAGVHLQDAGDEEAEMPIGLGEVDFKLLKEYVPATQTCARDQPAPRPGGDLDQRAEPRRSRFLACPRLGCLVVAGLDPTHGAGVDADREALAHLAARRGPSSRR